MRLSRRGGFEVFCFFAGSAMLICSEIFRFSFVGRICIELLKGIAIVMNSESLVTE